MRNFFNERKTRRKEWKSDVKKSGSEKQHVFEVGLVLFVFICDQKSLRKGAENGGLFRRSFANEKLLEF